MRALILLALCAAPLAAQERIVRVVTVYTYADGRKVVVEETSDAPKGTGVPAQASPHVPCEVRPPAIVATGPPAPPVILPTAPTYYYPAPTYYVPQAPPAPMPAYRPAAGAYFRGPFGGGIGAELCLPGGR